MSNKPNVNDFFLSGSTLAHLTGETNMEKLDIIQGKFIDYALKDASFERWQDAWNSDGWKKILKGDN